MITSKKLTAERLEEIKNYPISYDEDSPKLTKEQIEEIQKHLVFQHKILYNKNIKRTQIVNT